jgi:hypothetical protein
VTGFEKYASNDRYWSSTSQSDVWPVYPIQAVRAVREAVRKDGREKNASTDWRVPSKEADEYYWPVYQKRSVIGGNQKELASTPPKALLKFSLPSGYLHRLGSSFGDAFYTRSPLYPLQCHGHCHARHAHLGRRHRSQRYQEGPRRQSF